MASVRITRANIASPEKKPRRRIISMSRIIISPGEPTATSWSSSLTTPTATPAVERPNACVRILRGGFVIQRHAEYFPCLRLQSGASRSAVPALPGLRLDGCATAAVDPGLPSSSPRGIPKSSGTMRPRAGMIAPVSLTVFDDNSGARRGRHWGTAVGRGFGI